MSDKIDYHWATPSKFDRYTDSNTGIVYEKIKGRWMPVKKQSKEGEDKK